MRLRHALLSALLLACASAWAQVPDPIRADPKDWLTYSGQYHAQRHSLLRQITAANVGRLEAKWVYHMTGQKDLEATPIVANGVMYISQYNRIDAIDARSGNVIWQFQRQPIATGPQRGTGFWNNKLFVTTSDKHLLALDARNGSVLWDVAVHDGLQLAGQAPLIVKGKLIVSGNLPHGFIQSYEADTGKYLWSWSPLPADEDPQLASWGGQKPDGAPIWVSGSYDPELNLIYYGTGQPEPQWAGEGRKGDNLYSDCIVALDPDTGKLKWWYQNTPHDTHDYDSLEMPVLVDADWKGKPRKLLLQANRNGFYYILDRTNGEFLQATQFVKQVDWLKGWEGNGHPIPDPAHDPSVLGTTTCPSTSGATNWPSPTYDPELHLFFFVAQEGCGVNLRDSARNYAGTGYLESPEAGKSWQLFTRALDAFTGKKVWDYEQVTSHHYGPGLMSTAGGVVFSPEEFGQFTALESKSGRVLWHFNTGDVITDSPISYSVDGKQYVVIISSTNVFAFGLPDIGGLADGGAR
jgi:alcohol dehydrogenase (cytochrome c)